MALLCGTSKGGNVGLYFHFKKIGLFLSLFILCQVLVACNPDIKPGFYSGNLSRNGVSESRTDEVQTELVINNGRYGNITVRDSKKELLEEAQIKWNLKNNKIKFKMNRFNLGVDLTPGSLLNLSDRMYCYRGTSNYTVRLCFAQDQFSLSITGLNDRRLVLALNGLYSSQQSPLPLETPKSFKLSEAIENALNRSFDEKIEYQIVAEAKEKAKGAWLSLLPHLDFKDLIAVSSLVPRTIASFVADFVPFLLPTRWYQKNEARDLYEAEKMTLEILRADLAYNIESTAFGYDRDLMNENFYQVELDKLRKVYSHIVEICRAEIGKLGTPADDFIVRLDPVENFVRQDRNRLENALELEKTALAFQMGYTNPYVIQSFDIQESPLEIEKSQPLDSKSVVNLALQRSLELRQMDELISNSENLKKEWYFNWADPDVPAASALSFSLGPNLARAEAVVGEVIKRRTRAAAVVELNAANAVINYNRALKLYAITKLGIEKLRAEESLIFHDIDSAVSCANIHTSGGATQYVLSTYFQFKLKQIDALTAYRVARAQIRRVHFEYYYTRGGALSLM